MFEYQAIHSEKISGILKKNAINSEIKNIKRFSIVFYDFMNFPYWRYYKIDLFNDINVEQKVPN